MVLAAGKGTRMKSDAPKVAVSLRGKSLLNYVADNLIDAGFQRMVVVVGYRKEEVMGLMASYKERDLRVEFAEQTEQLGTAHAVLSASEALKDYRGPLLVTNGDMPMIRGETFRELLNAHQKNGYNVTVLSAIAENPFGYGRLVRDENGELLRVVEEKDASREEKEIKEINTGTYVFEAPEIFDLLRGIGTNNNQKEYYLPDAVELARAGGHRSGSVIVRESEEALGVNSPDDLRLLEEQLEKFAEGRVGG